MFEGKSLDDYQRGKRRIPRYELLYRLLLDEMIALPPEVEYLPYQEELANQFHLSRNTVRKTMAKLRSDGYICTRKKSGSRILKRTMEEHRPQVTRKTFHNSAGFLLANNVDDPHIKTSIRWELVNEVERQFRESGIRLSVYNLREDNWQKWKSPEKLVLSLRANGIGQVIYHPEHNPEYPWLELHRALLTHGIRVSLSFNSLFEVAKFSEFLQPHTDYVAVNHESCLSQTVQKLCTKPVKQLLYVTNENFRPLFSDFREEIIRRSAETCKLNYHYIISHPVKMSLEDYEAGRPNLDRQCVEHVQMLCLKTPSLVLCANDYTAYSLRKLAGDLPAELIGYDNTGLAKDLGISTFEFNMYARAEAFLSLFSAPTHDIRGIIVNSRFVKRSGKKKDITPFLGKM